MNIKLPGNKLLLLACVLLLLIGAFWVLLLQSYKVHFESNSIKISKIIARVEGAPLSELDLENYNRAQKLTLQDSILNPGLPGLKRITAMEIEARKQKVFPNQNELNNRLAEYLKKTGGKENADLKRAVEMELVKEKLFDYVTYWREAEFLALRYDVLPRSLTPNDITIYQGKSRGVLDQFRERFNGGESVVKLAQVVRDDETVKKDFVPNAVQYRELSADRLVRETQRFVKQNPSSGKNSAIGQSKPGDVVEYVSKPSKQDQHILDMAAPKSSDLWCYEDACLLIRVLDGSNGKYSSLDQWLKEKGL